MIPKLQKLTGKPKKKFKNLAAKVVVAKAERGLAARQAPQRPIDPPKIVDRIDDIHAESEISGENQDVESESGINFLSDDDELNNSVTDSVVSVLNGLLQEDYVEQFTGYKKRYP